MKTPITALFFAAFFSATTFSATAFGATSLAATSHANVVETSFTYAGIYSSLKASQQTQFSQISLNFYLMQKGRNAICDTSEVYLSDGEKKVDLIVSNSGQLMLPLYKSFKRDHAAITLLTPSDQACYLSMKIEVADFEFANTNVSNLLSWAEQMSALYSELAGWPGRYFMPAIIGFDLEFKKDVSATYLGNLQVQQPIESQANLVYLSLRKLSEVYKEGTMQFNQEIVSVRPRLAKQ
ncbi:MAG: DUF2987 domain-containing protein [Psychrobium sp.]|nr:DUF2987 domain-containing protein [Psychrobium sp.]